MSVNIIAIDDSHRDAWDSYVHGRDDASFYHLYAWRDFYRDVFRKETHYLVALDERNQIQGILPLVRQKSFFFGDYMVSLPFFNYGGVIAENEWVRKELVKTAISIRTDIGLSHIEFRDKQPFKGLPVRQDKVAMWLDLPDSEDALAKSLGAKRRSQIKRSQREHPMVLKGGTELLDDFYRVFSQNMRDLGTPVYSKVMFHEILHRFPKEAQIIVIRVQGQPAAVAFLFHHREITEIPWASTMRKFNAISMNMLLYWEVLRESIQRGSSRFDFGRSTMDSGTYRFKKQWGAKPVQLYWHYALGAGQEMPSLSPSSGKYDLAIKVWQHLPLWLTKIVGPQIVRNLP